MDFEDELNYMDREEELVLSLKVLLHTRTLEHETRRLKQDDIPLEEWEKGEPSYEEYKIEEGMFAKNTNSLAATRLLFEILDLKSTYEQFRTCWPIHEKSQEAEYRKIAYQWVVEIAEAHPEFFPFGNPSFSYFVNPYGERWLRFLECFTEYTMHTVALRQQEDPSNPDPVPVPEKFKENEDPEECEMQCRALHDHWKDLVQEAVEVQKSTMEALIYFDELEEQTQEWRDEIENEITKEMKTLSTTITENPTLFPENWEEVIVDRDSKIHEIIRSTPLMQIPVIEDPLLEVIMKAWRKKIQETRVILEKANCFFEQLEWLWNFLEAYEENTNVVLDAKKLNWPTESTTPELAEFVNYLITVLDKFQEKLNTIPALSPDELANFDSLNERMELGKERIEKLEQELSPEKIQTLREEMIFKISVLSTKLEAMDWSNLSKCKKYYPSDPVNFNWSPKKVINYNKGKAKGMGEDPAVLVPEVEEILNTVTTSATTMKPVPKLIMPKPKSPYKDTGFKMQASSSKFLQPRNIHGNPEGSTVVDGSVTVQHDETDFPTNSSTVRQFSIPQIEMFTPASVECFNSPPPPEIIVENTSRRVSASFNRLRNAIRCSLSPDQVSAIRRQSLASKIKKDKEFVEGSEAPDGITEWDSDAAAAFANISNSFSEDLNGSLLMDMSMGSLLNDSIVEVEEQPISELSKLEVEENLITPINPNFPDITITPEGQNKVDEGDDTFSTPPEGI